MKNSCIEFPELEDRLQKYAAMRTKLQRPRKLFHSIDSDGDNALGAHDTVVTRSSVGVDDFAMACLCGAGLSTVDSRPGIVPPSACSAWLRGGQSEDL